MTLPWRRLTSATRSARALPMVAQHAATSTPPSIRKRHRSTVRTPTCAWTARACGSKWSCRRRSLTRAMASSTTTACGATAWRITATSSAAFWTRPAPARPTPAPASRPNPPRFRAAAQPLPSWPPQATIAVRRRRLSINGTAAPRAAARPSVERPVPLIRRAQRAATMSLSALSWVRCPAIPSCCLRPPPRHRPSRHSPPRKRWCPATRRPSPWRPPAAARSLTSGTTPPVQSAGRRARATPPARRAAITSS